jgi:HK97 family phage major capsid protein
MSHALKAAIEDAAKTARAIADRAIAENRELSEGEQAEFTAHFQKAADAKKTLMGFADRKSQLAELSADLGTLDAEAVDGVWTTETKSREPEQQGNGRGRKSIGQRFVESPEWQAMVKSAPGGVFSDSIHVQGQPFGFKALTTGVDDTSAGGLVQADYRGLLDPYYTRPLTIRQLVTNGSTTSDAIEFVRLVSVTNNAAPVPEAVTDGPISATAPIVTPVQAGLKPQSDMDFLKDSTTVKTIAHWLAATKRALSDAAQIRTLIDNFLTYGVELALENQIITGDGVGENFLGLNNTSGLQTDTGVGSAITGVEACRRARRKVQIGGRTIPTAYAFNPIDWEKIELLRDTQQRFYGNGPFAMGPQTLWGLPVVESEALPAGTAYCADWRQAVLWDREQASIQITDSHADFFVRNLVAILSELRAAFAVLRPPAFCKITLT